MVWTQIKPGLVSLYYNRHAFIIFLPPANDVCEGYVFTRVCLSTTPSTWVGTPPGSDTPPGNRYPPRTRYTPQDQVHPPRQVHTPRDQVPPQTRYTPGQVPPPPGPGTQCMLGDTGNKRAVDILLECILV